MGRFLSFSPQGYGLPVAVSVLLHLLVVLFLLSGMSLNLKSPSKPPEHIQAKLVTLAPEPKGPSAAELKRQQEQQKKQAAEAKRRAEAKRQADAKRQAEAKRKEEAKRKAELAKQAEAKRQAELKRKAEAAKQAEAKREAEAKRQAEAKRKAAEARAREEAAARRAREQAALEQEMGNLLAAEEAERARAAAQAASEAELVAGYSQLIREQVAANWSRPPSARNGMQVVLLVQMVPTGEIVDVQVLSGSGSESFDRSAVQAVTLTARVAELQDLSRRYPRVFEREFRRFKFIFRPEDLLQ